MPTETPDVSVESSPTTFEIPASGPDYASWRQTGELPAKPKADSTPAKKTPASEEGNPAPASEPGSSHQEKKPKGDAAARLAELLDDIRQTGYTPADLKALRKQAPKTDAQPQAEPPKPAAPEKTENPAGDLKPPAKPVRKDFFEGGKHATYDEAETAYEAARDKYLEDMIDYKDAVRQHQRAQQESIRATDLKIAEAAKQYGGESEAVIRSTSKSFFEVKDGKIAPLIPPAVLQVVNDSPLWPHLVYTLGSGDPAELAAFMDLARTNPGAAIRKIVAMEGLIETELGKGSGKSAAAASEASATPPRGDDGKFQKSTPDKQESKAPPPAREVSGRGGTPPDELDQAVKANDFRTLQRLENQRDMERRRGR